MSEHEYTKIKGEASFDKTLERVRKLINQAEHEGTDPAEAAKCRALADALMLKYAVDEALVRNAQPVSERSQPGTLEVAVAGGETDVVSWLGLMAENIARHCRCKIRLYHRYDSEQRVWMAKVYGFKSDLAYFEVLYTTVRLHALGVLRPSIDVTLSLEDNCYNLHNAGYNWLEIAELYGWRKTASMPGDTQDIMYRHRDTGERKSNWQLGSQHKRAYYKAIKARGEGPTKITASGSKTYRVSAARGYSSRINQRLREMVGSRASGAEIILASSVEDLEDFFREDRASNYTRCPRCEKLGNNQYECEHCGQFIRNRPEPCPRCEAAASGHCRQHPAGSSRWTTVAHDERAYAAGVRHANSADLGDSTKVSSNQAGELS